MTRTRARLVVLAVTALAAGLAGTALAAPAGAAPPDRPGTVANGNFWQLRSTLTGGTANATFTYGSTNDFWHVTGDWDGDGTRTPGIVRASGNTYFWYLRNSNTGGAVDVTPFSYGKPDPLVGVDAEDWPIVGDWDGDGRDTVGVVRVAYGVRAPRWLLRNSTTSGSAQNDFAYGSAVDTGFVTGDWDGNGTDTPGLVRSPEGVRTSWLLRQANASGTAQLQFQYGSATAEEVPVAGDWDGDGRDGIGLVRNEGSRNRWLLRETATTGGAQHSFLYGSWASDPVVWS